MLHRPTMIVTLLLAALLVGCGGIEPGESPAAGSMTEPASDSPTDVSTTQPGAPEPVFVEDALGRQVTFAEHPRRIAIAGRATALIAHSLYLFPEALDRIVAIEDRAQRDLSFYTIVDPHFDQKMLLERNAGPEQILPANPDVVIMKSYLAESLGEPIEQLGIPVVYLDLETPAQFERDITVIGNLLGNPQRAEEIIEYYAARTERIQSLIPHVSFENYPSVLLLQYSDRGGEVAFNVPAVEWLQTSLVELAGGYPVWLDAAQAGGWTIVGLEQIAAWEPQVVIVIYYPANPASIVERLKADANWQSLSATRNDSIYGFPGDFLSWDQPDPRWILGLGWLAKTLHPEEAASIDLEAEITGFYEQMYGLDPEVIQQEVIPRLHLVIE